MIKLVIRGMIYNNLIDTELCVDKSQTLREALLSRGIPCPETLGSFRRVEVDGVPAALDESVEHNTILAGWHDTPEKIWVLIYMGSPMA